MKRLFTVALFMVALILSPLFALPAEAGQFNRHHIISDLEFFDQDAMTGAEIQSFLERRGSFLATYRTRDARGKMLRASEIIHNAAQEHGVSPRALLVTLQKEQSLIEGSAPTTYGLTWATGYARCDSCSADDPGIAKYKGFGTQVDRSAWRFRYYSDHPNEFNFHVSEVATVDGEIVVPANQATVGLYNYTPHLHGNENFWELWQRYFARDYPDGTLVQVAGEPGVWLIQRSLKRPILTKSALASRFDSDKILQIEKADLDKYDEGDPIKFPQYSVLRSPGGTVYLIDGDLRRGFASREAFRLVGIHPEEVLDVGWEDLHLYQEGSPITADSLHPTGALMQDSQTGAVHWVQDGTRHPIWGREILASRFKNHPIVAASPEELSEYEAGAPLGFKDGALVTAPGFGQVFVISNQKKRPFASAEAFNALGYKWDQIITATPALLNLMPTGAPLTN